MKRIITAALAVLVVAAAAVPAGAGEPSYGFKFGGYIKTDASWDDTRIYPGNYRLWVQPYEEKNNAFYLTANESRLAFDFWWDQDDYKTKAYLEFDFYGGGAENKANPMLRHAYVKLDAGSWQLLFGQTWDIISPLNPKTVNYSVMWTQGNIGYRRPQMRFTYKMKMSEDATLKLDAGVTRNIGIDLDGDDFNDGTDAAVPTFQGRLGFGMPVGEEGKLSIGASSHYGNERSADPVTGEIDAIDTPSWSINGDLAIKVNKKVAILGEFFYGENLKQYLGGISQGVNPIGGALPAMGGWGMVQLRANDKMLFNAGYGFDDPDDAEWIVPDDTETYTLRDWNSEMFANLMYGPTSNVSLMFEAAYMQTKYLDRSFGEDDVLGDYNGMRFQFAVKAAFK